MQKCYGGIQAFNASGSIYVEYVNPERTIYRIKEVDHATGNVKILLNGRNTQNIDKKINLYGS